MTDVCDAAAAVLMQECLLALTSLDTWNACTRAACFA